MNECNIHFKIDDVIYHIKTDWINGDHFNYEDWNRINENFRNGVSYISEHWHELPVRTYSSDKTVTDYATLDEMNTLNDMSNIIMSNTIAEGSIDRRIENGAVWSANEINFIEETLNKALLYVTRNEPTSTTWDELTSYNWGDLDRNAWANFTQGIIN